MPKNTVTNSLQYALLVIIACAGCSDANRKLPMSKQPSLSNEDAASLLSTFDAKLSALKQKPIPDRLQPTSSRIQEFEEHIGAKLPDDYRLFLTKFAGVSVSATCPIREPSPCGDEATIDLFYGFMPEEKGYNSLAENSDDADGAPVVIPIAGGAFGSQIYLILSGRLSGTVCFYDAQQRFFWTDAKFHSMFSNLAPNIEKYLELRKNDQLPRKPNGMENFYVIADSFTDFIESMKYSDLGG